MEEEWYAPIVGLHTEEIERQKADVSFEWRYNEERERVEFFCPETDESWWVAKGSIPYENLGELVEGRISNAQWLYEREE